jgi:hypothetical protein
MQNCHDDDMLLFQTKIDAEWKAPHEGSPRLPIHDRINKRLLMNETKHRVRFVQESVAEAASLLLIPRC